MANTGETTCTHHNGTARHPRCRSFDRERFSELQYLNIPPLYANLAVERDELISGVVWEGEEFEGSGARRQPKFAPELLRVPVADGTRTLSLPRTAVASTARFQDGRLEVRISLRPPAKVAVRPLGYGKVGILKAGCELCELFRADRSALPPAEWNLALAVKRHDVGSVAMADVNLTHSGRVRGQEQRPGERLHQQVLHRLAPDLDECMLLAAGCAEREVQTLALGRGKQRRRREAAEGFAYKHRRRARERGAHVAKGRKGPRGRRTQETWIVKRRLRKLSMWLCTCDTTNLIAQYMRERSFTLFISDCFSSVYVTA